MPDRTVHVPVDKLEAYLLEVFNALGVPPEDARIVTEISMASDLRGIESHGIGRLNMYYVRMRAGIQQPVTRLEIVKDTPTTAVIDGGVGMGQVVGYRAMQMAIEKARRYGLGAVAARNSSHFGIDGYYPLMAVKAGMVGMSFTNARPAIAPTFGVTPLLGTNPIAFGAPTDEPFPFLFDAATSITQRGKIEVLDRAEKPAPEGWLINQDGTYATDPGQILRDLGAMKVAFLPLGGATEEMGSHKGYGLATMVEIFSAAFAGGLFLSALVDVDEQGKPMPLRLGHFFLAIDVEHFVPLEQFKKTAGGIVRELRAAQKMPGHDRIYTAGEKEYHNEQRVRREGVEINPNLQKVLLKIQRELGLTKNTLEF